MKLGAVFPQIEMPADPIIIRDYAQAIEEMGFDYLLAYDHVLGANPDRPGGWKGRPYSYTDPFHEIFVLFGYLTGLTKTLEMVAGVLVLPQRQTALVAKQAAQLDVLSGGRIRLGVGVGWNDVEFEALNEEFSNRGKRQAEQIELMNELWSKPLVTFNGEFHTVSDAGLNPLPVQQPLPVWFGGYADAALRRMARLGAGWFPGSQTPEKAGPTFNKIREYISEAGRDPASFGLDPWVSNSRSKRSDWTPLAKEWQQIGATHLALETMRCGYSIDQHLDAAKQFIEEVGEFQT